jgi:hypothetical protein
MKTQIILTTLILASILLNACDTITNIRPSDQITTQQYSFSDYDQIETESAFSVYVTFSDTEEKIEIEANDNLHQYIEVKKESGTLKIGFRDNVGYRGSATLNAYITTRNVAGYTASGASRFIVDGDISGENASVFLSGASRFSGEMHVENLFADLSGASVMQLTGSADTSDLMASGASSIEDYEFSTDYLTIHLTGASNAFLTVTEEMDVTASGASIVRYKGTGVVNSQNISGGSQIINMN